MVNEHDTPPISIREREHLTTPHATTRPPHSWIGIYIYVSHNFDSSSSYSYVYVRVDVGLTLTCRQIQWTTHFQTMHIEKEKGNGNLIKIHHCRFWYRHNKTTHGETGIGYWVGVRVRERMDERRRGKGGTARITQLYAIRKSVGGVN